MKGIQQVFGMKSLALILGGCGAGLGETAFLSGMWTEACVSHVCVYIIMVDWRDLFMVSLFTITEKDKEKWTVLTKIYI